MKFVLGIILSTILLMSGLGYDVNYAEADHADQSEADAINDLALQSISKYNNKSDRNNITLTWSAPNNNGGAISQYILQVHETSGSGWTTLDNNIQGTTYTHSKAATGYQFSYRVFALSPDGCHGSGNYLDGCNQGNILDVVSLPNAERGAPTPQCENKKLDDCGYFADPTPPPKSPDPTPPPKSPESTPAPPPKSPESTPAPPKSQSEFEQKKEAIDAFCNANPGECYDGQKSSVQKNRDSMFSGIMAAIVILIIIGIGILFARKKLHGSFGGGSGGYDDDGYDDDGYDDDR